MRADIKSVMDKPLDLTVRKTSDVPTTSVQNESTELCTLPLCLSKKPDQTISSDYNVFVGELCKRLCLSTTVPERPVATREQTEHMENFTDRIFIFPTFACCILPCDVLHHITPDMKRELAKHYRKKSTLSRAETLKSITEAFKSSNMYKNSQIVVSGYVNNRKLDALNLSCVICLDPLASLVKARCKFVITKCCTQLICMHCDIKQRRTKKPRCPVCRKVYSKWDFSYTDFISFRDVNAYYLKFITSITPRNPQCRKPVIMYVHDVTRDLRRPHMDKFKFPSLHFISLRAIFSKGQYDKQHLFRTLVQMRDRSNREPVAMDLPISTVNIMYRTKGRKKNPLEMDDFNFLQILVAQCTDVIIEATEPVPSAFFKFILTVNKYVRIHGVLNSRSAILQALQRNTQCFTNDQIIDNLSNFYEI